MTNNGLRRNLHKLHLDKDPGNCILIHPNSGSDTDVSQVTTQAIRAKATGIVGSMAFLAQHVDLLLKTPIATQIGLADMQSEGVTGETWEARVQQAVQGDVAAVIAPFGLDHQAGLTNLSYLIGRSSYLGVPIIGKVDISPQTTQRLANPDAYAQHVRHAARVAVELGVHAVAAPYTDSFGTLVDSTMGIPVLVTNRQNQTPEQNLSDAAHAKEAGAYGVLFDHTAFETAQFGRMTTALGYILNRGTDVVSALMYTADLAHPAHATM